MLLHAEGSKEGSTTRILLGSILACHHAHHGVTPALCSSCCKDNLFEFDLSFADFATTSAALEYLAVLAMTGRKTAQRSIHEALSSLNCGTYNPCKSQVKGFSSWWCCRRGYATVINLLQKKEKLQTKREVRKILLSDSAIVTAKSIIHVWVDLSFSIVGTCPVHTMVTPTPFHKKNNMVYACWGVLSTNWGGSDGCNKTHVFLKRIIGGLLVVNTDRLPLERDRSNEFVRITLQNQFTHYTLPHPTITKRFLLRRSKVTCIFPNYCILISLGKQMIDL